VEAAGTVPFLSPCSTSTWPFAGATQVSPCGIVYRPRPRPEFPFCCGGQIAGGSTEEPLSPSNVCCRGLFGLRPLAVCLLSFFFDILVGATPGSLFALRYCYVSQFRVDFNATVNGGPTPAGPNVNLCAMDSTYFQVDITDTTMLSVQPTTIFAVPGMPAPTVTVTASYLSGGPVLFQFVTMIAPGTSTFSINSACQSCAAGAPPGVAVAPYDQNYPNAVFPAVTFAAGTPDGSYTVQVIAAGATTKITYIVSSQVVQMSVDLPNTNVPVGGIFVATVQALGVSGQTIAGLQLEATLTRVVTSPGASPLALPANASAYKCSGSQECGVMTPQSVTFGTTGTLGVLAMPLAFDAAATGAYTLSVAVISGSLSDTTLGQLVRRNIQSLSFLLGVPTSQLYAMTTMLNPRAAGVVQILLALSDTTGSSSTVASSDSSTSSGGVPPSPSDGSSTASALLSTAASITPEIASYLTSAVFGGVTESSFQETLDRIKAVFATALTVSVALNAASSASAQSNAVGTTAAFAVWNGVASLTIERQPNVHAAVHKESDSFEVLVGTSSFQETFDDNNAPVVRLWDQTGGSVSQANVDVTVNPPTGLALSQTAFTSGPDGRVSLVGVGLQYQAAGTYTLHFASRGCQGNSTAAGSITVEFTQMTVEQTMRTFSVYIILGFAPMFVASVTHSRVVYSLLAAVLSTAIFVGICVFTALTWTDLATNFFSQAYFVFVGVCAGTCAVMQLLVTLFDFLSRVRNMPKFRRVNDEGRSLQTFEYARFITNARVEEQEAAALREQAAAAAMRAASGRPSVVVRMKDKTSGLKSRVTDKVQALDSSLQLELLDKTALERQKQGLVRRSAERPKLVTPKGLVSARLPVNLQVVFGISSILCMMNLLFVLFLYLKLHDALGKLLNYIPLPPANADLEKANEVFVAGLSDALTIISRVSPSFAFLSQIANPIRQVNLLGILVWLRNFVQAIIDRALGAFITGTILAVGIVLGTMGLTAFMAPRQILQIRRGEITSKVIASPSVSAIEPYVGLHSLHLFILFHMVFWPVIVVAFVVSIAILRDWIIEKVLVVALASIGSLIVSILVRKFIVNIFLIEGWAVIRPQIYAIYSFMDLVLGIFGALIATAVRWAQAVAFITVVFAKLDESVFPKSFAFLDSAHNGYMTMLASEARQSNPVLLLVAASMLLRQRLLIRAATCNDGSSRLDADASRTSSRPTVATQIQVNVDTFGTLWDGSGESIFESGMIVNLARMLLRDRAGVPADLTRATTSLQTFTVESTARNRVINRFWLWVVLHNNPSIRRHRKHQIWVRADEIRVLSPTIDDDDALRAAGLSVAPL
jgi:hypothetical protein